MGLFVTKMNKIFNIFLVFTLFLMVSCHKEYSPICKITSPENGEEFYENEDIIVEVTAEERDGAIAYLHLYIDGMGYSSTSTLPYNFTIKAGDLTAGAHTIKAVAKNSEGKQAETSVTITIKEKEVVIDTESPDFVTFSDGKLPIGWETNGWFIDQMGGNGGYDDVYSLYAKTVNATVTAKKTCNWIQFYMKGAGIVNFYLDGELLSEIIVEYSGWGGGLQGWKYYSFYFPDEPHSFTWEYVDKLPYDSKHRGVNLDAIKFPTKL